MKIAVLDIETTGFNPHNDCILEIGIVELCLETGNKKIIYNKTIKEEHYSERHKNAWIFSNSDLSHDIILESEPLNKSEIQEILNKYKVTAYNKKFDFSFLKNRGFSITELPCPMLIATNVCKIPKNFGSGYKWPKVPEAYHYLLQDFNYIETHRGAQDALDEAEIVYKLYEMGEYII